MKNARKLLQDKYQGATMIGDTKKAYHMELLALLATNHEVRAKERGLLQDRVAHKEAVKKEHVKRREARRADRANKPKKDLRTSGAL